MYSIVMGLPEMQDFWSTLCSKVKSGSATKDEVKLHTGESGILNLRGYSHKTYRIRAL